MANIRWVSTGELGVRVLRAKMPGGDTNLVLYGVKPDNFAWDEALKKGFTPTKSGTMLYRKTDIFTLSEIRSIFPKTFMLEVPEENTYLRIASAPTVKPVTTTPAVEEPEESAPAVSDGERSAAIEMSGCQSVGRNYLGQEVFEDSAKNRFVTSEGKGARISEADMKSASAFLRAADDESLSLCADGFVLRMLSGEALSFADVGRFAGVVYGEDKPLPATDVRLRKVQESIEAAIFRNFAKTHSETDASDFNDAVTLERLQPKMSARTSTSVDLQQYSTPLSMSIAAQSVLKDIITPETRLLEPTIGNGSLVSMLNCNVTGYDLDEGRISLVGQLGFTVEQKDFLSVPMPSKKYDVVIANPPFGGLNSPVEMFNEIKVTRIDHLIMLRALEMRRDDGAAVFIIGGDYSAKMSGNPGRLDGGSKNLFNWLVDHYNVSAFEIDGSLYEKQGAAFPVRMVVVGAKLSASEVKARTRKKNANNQWIETLSVATSHEEMWKLAKEAQAILGSENVDTDNISDVVDVNEFQVSYTPLSSVGESSSVLPINLSDSQRKAFKRLSDAVGDVDDYVARSLRIERDQLGKFFTPEQIDATALAIWNIERGRGLILGDATGQGKGRVMAAITRYAAINKMDGIFLTEKQNLFSDLWRDITDIGTEEIIAPFLVNNDANIINFETGNTIFKSASSAAKKRLFYSDAGEMSLLDEGATTMFATYSQFNRPSSALARARWLSEVQQGSIVMLDESHNAAGESNTGVNIASAIRNAAGAVYSSATFAKDAKNFGVYSKAFPPSVNLETLQETLAIGGPSLMEVLSGMLVEDGVMVCRQNDISNLSITPISPSDRLRVRNRELSAKMSEILLAMSNLSGDVSNVAEIKNKEMKKKFDKLGKDQKAGNRMGVRSVNFGSRLYNINRQFLLALSIDLCIDRAKDALARGEKPVLVIEQTMESVMKELMSNDDADVNDNGEVTQQPLMFRDVLRRMLGKIQEITINNGYGKTVKTDIFSIADDKEQVDSAKAIVKSINEMIDAFPDLSCNPIDDFRNALELGGWKTDEISGRSMMAIKGSDDSTVFVERGSKQRAKTVFDFNTGKIDALVITRAGSAGLSLHAFEKFKDQRKRLLLEAQIANDVNVRIQFFGRVNRRGQTSIPSIESITSGLPCEVRNLSMQNHKLRKLSANTTSNRKNKAEIDDCPDILNDIGNRVCFEYLLENPDIATSLGIDLDKKDEESEYFVNKLTGHIMLLHPDVQDKVFSEVFALYNDKIQELTMKGINPLEERVFDVKATVTDSFTLASGSGDSVFDAPVIAEKLEWKEVIEPIRRTRLMEMIQLGIERIQRDERYDASSKEGFEYLHSYSLKESGVYVNRKEIPVMGFLVRARKQFQILMERSLSGDILKLCKGDLSAGVDMALAMTDPNIIKTISERREWMERNLRSMMPGHVIQLTYGDEPVKGIITSIELPEYGKEHYMGQWHAKVLIPGRDMTINMSLNQIMSDEKFQAVSFDTSSMMGFFERVDNAPGGEIDYSRWVLTGNLFAASEIAAANSYGRAGIFTDKNNVRHRAILCREYVDRHVLLESRVPIATPQEATDLFVDELSTSRGNMKLGEGFSISYRDGDISLFVPGSKANGGGVFLDPDLLKALGAEFSGSRSSMSVKFKADYKKVLAMMVCLYKNKLTLPRPTEKVATPTA